MKYNKQWLTESELRTILNLPDLSEKYEVWILLMYVPALRVSEAINIQVKDLDLEKERVLIWGGKNKDNTELQVAPCDIQTLKKIKRYADHNNLKPTDYIMFSNKSSQVHRSHVYNVLNDIVEKAGIDKKIGTHTLRRSRAEHLLDSGLSFVKVSRYLRHKNIATTMNYLDVSVADIQNELKNIDDPIIKMY